jgi:hypothetical protein
MDERLHHALDTGWKTSCRILFGQEIGELGKYGEWLGEYLPPRSVRESCLSGKEVTLEGSDYCDSAKFISSDEINSNSITPLSINEIKDIDSIAEALSEKWMYAGNKILGNSGFVVSSDQVTDSRNIFNSTNIERCSEVFSAFSVRKGSKHVYGGGLMGASEFMLRSIAAFNAKRTFESQFIVDSSDIYLSHSCSGCNDVMFSFFQRNKRYAIGNLQLSKDKYLELKKKLLREVAQHLIENGKFPSLFGLVPDRKPDCSIELDEGKDETDLEVIDRAFASTYKVLFRKSPETIVNYEDWLLRHTMNVREMDTPFGRKTRVPTSSEYIVFSRIPKNRTVTFYEGLGMGKLRLDEEDLDSLEKVREGLGKIGCFSPEYITGNNRNVIQTPIAFNAVGAYKTYDSTYSENVGLSSMSGNSRSMFGCSWIVESSFCINCYTSAQLSRCFEADTSTNCSDAYFVHGSEGLTDCMFCWNAKGLRNAIGNLVLEPKRYSEVKDRLLAQVAEEIERNRSLGKDIFNIGCRGRRLWNQKLMES